MIPLLLALLSVASAFSVALDPGASDKGGASADGAVMMPNGDVDAAFLEALRDRRSGGGGMLGPGTADPWSLGGVEGFPEERRPWGGGGKARGGEGGAGRAGEGRGARARGGSAKPQPPPPPAPKVPPDFAEELAVAGGRLAGGGRGRQFQQPPPALSPYQLWLQGQLTGQPLKPEHQQMHLPAQYPRPQPPPDYQQLKGRQFRPRLQKLDAYFGRLGVLSEDCRQRLLCEVARSPDRFFPLSFVLEEEAGFTGNYQYLTSQLINSTEGARLLSYMEANFRGQDRARTCDVFRIRCLSSTEDMINFQSLVVWREMIRWLTIHILTRIP
ncbi:uncharacterized protein LOC124153277 [Ischnura elegans]|uniref:uncharacterized protein LOC124153277 n=1 Tax=Ischnura elegans TaxID=197161 RepID=UPI001ED89D76|nr:uncharacterized protein LOC124153277 [Ischnura elegans]